jgi:hypothetical protein
LSRLRPIARYGSGGYAQAETAASGRGGDHLPGEAVSDLVRGRENLQNTGQNLGFCQLAGRTAPPGPPLW